MPGLVGAVTCTKQSPSLNINEMLTKLSAVRDVRSTTILLNDNRVSVSARILPQTVLKVIESSDGQVVLFLKGDLYNTTVEEILDKYEHDGISCFKNILFLDGSFSGGLLDRKKRELYLVSDPIGLDPLYYCYNKEHFCFASEIKALQEIPTFFPEISKQTLLDFWTYGFALGNKTPFENIHLLPSGSILALNLNSFKMSLISYCEILDFFSARSASSLEEVSESFLQAVQCRSNDFQTKILGISLSGGLDSRAILGGLGGRSNGIVSYTLGLPDCADERLAKKMATALGTKHSFIPITDKDLKDFESLASMMITLSDGLYHPHESTEQVAMDYLARQPFEVMLRGHGGEIAKASLAYPFQASETLASISPEETLERLWKKASLAKSDIKFENIFVDQIMDVYNERGFPFQEELKAIDEAGMSNFDICIYFYITQWIRRQVVASLSIFRNQVDIRLPYLDRRFLALLLSLPTEKRWSGEFHKEFIRKFCPKLLAIPDSNTGAPLDAGYVRVFLTGKFHGVLKKLGVRGFRHYTDFQKWQREQFRTTTENILLSERALARNYYQPDGLRKIITLHNEGKKNYAHFLGTAVGVELWHRNFIDN